MGPSDFDGRLRTPMTGRPKTGPAAPVKLKTYVYDASTDHSDLVVLDADHLARESVATIHLPRWVPAGFHGGRLADA